MSLSSEMSMYFSEKRIEELVSSILGRQQLETDAPAIALLAVINRLAYDEDFTIRDSNAVRLTQAVYRRTKAFEDAAFAFANQATDENFTAGSVREGMFLLASQA